MDQQHHFALEFLNLLPLDDFKTILDVGAGPGYQTQWLREQGKNATAVDVINYTKVDVPFMEADMTVRIPVDDGGVHAIWSHHALEHVLNPLAALHEFNRVLKPGGWLYLTVPQIDTTISDGHIISFNMPLVIYQLALAGFDVRLGYFGKFRSHLRAAVQKTERPVEWPWSVTIRQMSDAGILPASTEAFVQQTGRFNGESLTTTWLDGSTHTY